LDTNEELGFLTTYTASMPEERDAAATSWPLARSMPTSLAPMKPRPPMITIRISAAHGGVFLL
jgi:hypothetical protein